ncbi:hypothetical protein OAN307_c09530 [Octadecabacter antarcticus 307]|uniref:Uncharacterized protein n=1 Tax=Octadecabacter antarcticus 307 TaxID=391626 RepID=M9R362_9RHOB|nr:hypothetical protein [Octadecabacter antarcticus]AGI66672.1 hypothetical protein OAN307_c09530 [Octadecabacter antarcticus 307]
MAKLDKTTIYTAADPAKETMLDKTARIAREIKDGDIEQREIKTARLRNARLENEAMTPDVPMTAAASRARTRR